jgi:uncharacterized protein (TIGR02145 family)
MEPTIYKPSIYKGAGIYKTGAEGGGGGGFGRVEIGGKFYSFIKIGSLFWTVQNLDYTDINIILGGTPTYDENAPHAWYYQNNENEFGWNGKKFGLLYNNLAAEYLEQNKETILNGFRVPKEADFQNLEDTIGQIDFVNKLKSTQYWNAPGIDEYGFSMIPGGACSGDDVTPIVWAGLYTQSNIRMVTSDQQGKIFRANNDNTYELIRTTNPSFGISMRLCKDI